MQDFIRHDVGLNWVEARGLDTLAEVPDLVYLVDACIPVIL